MSMCPELFDKLWPASDWTEEVAAEFWRRVNDLPLNREQVEAVLREFRMTTRFKSPVPADLLRKLHAAAYPPKADRAPTDSEYDPRPPSGPVLSLAEYRRRAAEQGIELHPNLRGMIGGKK